MSTVKCRAKGGVANCTDPNCPEKRTGSTLNAKPIAAVAASAEKFVSDAREFSIEKIREAGDKLSESYPTDFNGTKLDVRKTLGHRAHKPVYEVYTLTGGNIFPVGRLVIDPHQSVKKQIENWAEINRDII
jgi:hypothetical protein